MPKTDHWRTDLKAPKHPPKIVNCFKCRKEFGIKWLTTRKAFSKKNDWGFWTGETEGDKKMCDNCLIDLYKNNKPLYWEKVKDIKKRNMMSSYTTNGHLVAS